MDWAKGYTASYYMTRVDPLTWRDKGRIEITGGYIKREPSGLRQSATVDCVNYEPEKSRPEDVIVEEWVRLYMDVSQAGKSEHIALFTGLATSPEDEYEGARKENSLDVYSVLKVVDDVKLLRGWYAPANISCTSIIERLMAVTPAPVIVPLDLPVLKSYIVAEDRESNLTMVDKILTAINWRMRVLGDGTITFVDARTTGSLATFDPEYNPVIETQIKVIGNLFDCPNVFLAICDDITAIARDENENSPLSIQRRGREVWYEEDGCTLAENETPPQYAMRRLKEEQRVARTASYDRRFVPDVYPSDTITLRYPEQTLNGDYIVESQSIELTHGGRTSEEITEVMA